MVTDCYIPEVIVFLLHVFVNILFISHSVTSTVSYQCVELCVHAVKLRYSDYRVVLHICQSKMMTMAFCRINDRPETRLYDRNERQGCKNGFALVFCIRSTCLLKRLCHKNFLTIRICFPVAEKIIVH